jgi:hypothetical protein
MDRHWYHRFLDGAVAHGRSIEDWLLIATGTEVFSLASGIKQASGIPLGRERKLRSQHRINLFYGGFFVAFAALTVVFYMHVTKPGRPPSANVQAAPTPVAPPSVLPAVAPDTAKATELQGGTGTDPRGVGTVRP